MDFEQLLDAYFRVDGRRVQLRVSKQLLDVTDVRAAFEHQRGAGVPQQVATAPEARALHPSGHVAREHVGIERPAVAGDEQRLRARIQT